MRAPGATLRRVLERFRLLSFFKHTTFSDEVGIRKPAPEIFALTLRAVGGEPGTAVHVGDDPILDVQGAHAAGMRAVQVTSARAPASGARSEEHTSELQSRLHLVCRLLLEKKKSKPTTPSSASRTTITRTIARVMRRPNEVAAMTTLTGVSLGSDSRIRDTGETIERLTTL